MRIDNEIRLWMTVDQRTRELRHAHQVRLARRHEARLERRRVRRTVGRSLVRLGHRLAGEHASVLEPARSR